VTTVVKVKFDGGIDIPVKDHFIFVEDPIVTSVDPRISLVRYALYLGLSVLAVERSSPFAFVRYLLIGKV